MLKVAENVRGSEERVPEEGSSNTEGPIPPGLIFGQNRVMGWGMGGIQRLV